MQALPLAQDFYIKNQNGATSNQNRQALLHFAKSFTAKEPMQTRRNHKLLNLFSEKLKLPATRSGEFPIVKENIFFAHHPRRKQRLLLASQFTSCKYLFLNVYVLKIRRRWSS